MAQLTCVWCERSYLKGDSTSLADPGSYCSTACCEADEIVGQEHDQSFTGLSGIDAFFGRQYGDSEVAAGFPDEYDYEQDGSEFDF